MVAVIDSHCHLSHLRMPVADVLEAAAAAGVDRVVDVGMGTAQAALSVARAAEHPGRVYAAVGIHPNDVREYVADPDATIATLTSLLHEPGVVAVGETGLDFYRDRSDPADQVASFEAHIDLARRLDKTLVIHCRDAQERVLEVLDAADLPGRVVMHCFSGDADHARACADRGFYCSFAGNLTYKANAGLREAAAVLPADLLLVETDAPYLAPMPHRGKDNSPSLVRLTADALAACRGLEAPALDPALVANTERAFALT